MNDSRCPIPRRLWAERDPVYRRTDLFVGGTLLAFVVAWLLVVSVMMGLGG